MRIWQHPNNFLIIFLFGIVSVVVSYFNGVALAQTSSDNEEAFRSALLELDPQQNETVSISPFPYDLTPSALENVNQIVSNSGGIYTVQLDNGIPWQHALDEDEFSREVMDDWERHKSSIGKNQKVYLAIAPLKDDRVSWAADHGGKEAPSWVQNEDKINPRILSAYKKYILRAIDYFQPQYLNIGVEAGDVAQKSSRRWPAMEQLFSETYEAVKRDNPRISVGISWGLPLLMQKGVLQKSQGVIDNIDYVGISFYPYMQQFYSKIGGIDLPPPPEQWRQPLRWLSENISKPIAINETGYSSTDVTVSEYDLEMQGSEQLQAQFVEELAGIARRDQYLFTVFFLPIDFDELRRKLGIPIMKFWEHTGFFDQHLNPKPAWSAFRTHWLNHASESPNVNKEEKEQSVSNAMQVSTAGGKWDVVSEILLSDKKLVFETPDKISVSNQQVLKWDYVYSKEWSWAVKGVTPGQLADSETISLQIKSTTSGALYLQLKEVSGEAFFKVLEPTTNWQRLTENLSSFQIDEKTKTDGVLNPDKISSIMIADNAGIEFGKNGKRSIEMRDLYFLKK